MKKIIFTAMAFIFTLNSCTTKTMTANISQQNPMVENKIFGKWHTVEKTAVTTPFGTVWTLNSAEFGTDGKTLTGEFTKEDGNPMTEHLTYDFVKNYQNTGRDAVLMHNNYFKDLVVVFTVEKLTDNELALKALPNEKAGNLDFGYGILKFKRF